jgi:uncharacterized protein YndB with AHSA1/START domain
MIQEFIARASIVIDASRDKVWNALVDRAALKQFFFGSDVRSDWKEGSAITWSGVWDGKPYQDKGVVLKAERATALQYTHFSPLSGQPDTPDNYHTITIELSDQGRKTLVELSQDNNPTEDAQLHSEQNWKMVLMGLKKFVEA